MYGVLSSRKKQLKRFPSLKFRRSKSEILRPPLLENGSSWARYFHSGSYTCDVIYLTRAGDRLILEGFQSVFGSSICEMSVDSEAQFGENLSESSSEGWRR